MYSADLQLHDKFIMNLRRSGRRGGRGLRLHPLVFGTAALSLLATALPSSAFAASMGGSNPSLSSSSSVMRAASLLPALTAPTRRHLHIPHQRHQHNLPTNTLMMTRHGTLFAIRGGQNSSDDNYSMSSSTSTTTTSSPLFTRPIEKVTVVGGTHGNEYTGIWIIKSIDKQREIYLQAETLSNDQTSDASIMDMTNDKKQEVEDNAVINVYEKFPSLEIDTLLANPVAYMENKRFIDVDLNREFSVEKLRKVPTSANTIEECDVRAEFCSDGNVDMSEVLASLPHESVRAREIEGLLGPKFASSATIATATTMELPDALSNDASSSSNIDPRTCVVIDLHSTTSNMGITLIIPEGDALMSAAAAYVLHKCQERYGYDEAQCVMHALPQRQDRMNLSSCGRHGFTIEVGPTPQGVLRHDVVEKTETALHALLEFLHLSNSELLEQKGDGDNALSVLNQLRRIYPDGIVPCYRSAPAVRPGELSGKIAWPNDTINPNFPKWMIHKSVQDRDFEPLRVGDPLFVELDGTIVPYDGSHGDEVYLIFVNEGGYYYASSGTGIGVAVRSQFDLHTGELKMNSISHHSVNLFSTWSIVLHTRLVCCRE